jgi:hypothetical protein
MSGLVPLDLGHPHGTGVARVAGNDVAEAPRH